MPQWLSLALMMKQTLSWAWMLEHYSYEAWGMSVFSSWAWMLEQNLDRAWGVLGW